MYIFRKTDLANFNLQYIFTLSTQKSNVTKNSISSNFKHRVLKSSIWQKKIYLSIRNQFMLEPQLNTDAIFMDRWIYKATRDKSNCRQSRMQHWKHLIWTFKSPRISTEWEHFPQHDGIHPTVSGMSKLRYLHWFWSTPSAHKTQYIEQRDFFFILRVELRFVNS